MAQATAVEQESTARTSAFLARVYFLMFIGLAVTGFVALWVNMNPQFQSNLLTRPWFAWGLFILQIIVVAFLSARIMSLSTGAAAFLFLFYAALVGLSLSSIFLLYAGEQIASVFFLTSGTFLITSLVGLVLKRDMTSAGNILFMLLAGWALAWFVSWIFPFNNLNWALNIFGIALFVGLTAWDTQQLKKIGQQYGDHPAGGGLVVIGALKLYLDYINLFLLLLRASRR